MLLAILFVDHIPLFEVCDFVVDDECLMSEVWVTGFYVVIYKGK